MPPVSTGPAADEARRLLEELSGGRQPSSSSWSPGGASSPDDAGVFPPAGIPSYAPEPPPEAAPPPPPPPPSAPPPPPPAAEPRSLPPLPAAPGSAYPTILPAGDAIEEPPGRGRRREADDEAPRDTRPKRSRVLPILLLLVVVLGAGYLLVKLLGGSGDSADDTPVPRASRPVASAAASAPVRTYTAAQIALAMQDAHFKHGYDAGKAKAATGTVSDPEATCRELLVAERAKGYPWGAHDRQGCLVGTTS